MATPVPLVSTSFTAFGTPNPFARRPDPFLVLLGTIGGSAVGQALLPAVSEQQQLLQRGRALGPAADAAPPSTIGRLRERAATLRDAGQDLAAITQTILEAPRPAEQDLLTARQSAAALVRAYNALLALTRNAPLVLKGDLADSLKATASAFQDALATVGITIGADGTLNLDESTLASVLAPSSATLTTSATTLRDLGRALGTLGQQLRGAPDEALRYAPPPDPRGARDARPPAPVRAVAVSGASVVLAYLVAREQLRIFGALGGVAGSGTRFSAVA